MRRKGETKIRLVGNNQAAIRAATGIGLVLAAVTGYGSAGETVFYTGDITQARNEEFFMTSLAKPIKRLVITSKGGEVEAAVVLGRWVFANRLDVEVPNYCLSSCANYVFTAGARKTIRPGAVVAWHGNYHHLKSTGLWVDDVSLRMKKYGEDAETAERRSLELVEKLVGREREFFELIGVDEYICWIGKMPPYGAPNYYFLSKEDMARFGVRDVVTPPDYAKTDVSGFSDHIIYIDLEVEDGLR